jgi:hypothetical protein
MDAIPYLSIGPDGRPCIAYRLMPKPQLCPQVREEFWTVVQHFSLLLTLAVSIVSLFGD